MNPSDQTDQPLFQVTDLRVSVQEQDILKGLSITVRKGEIHAIMGPNGSGKSTLANALMGNEDYLIQSGSIAYKGTDVTAWETEPSRKRSTAP